ncbi:MAG: bis-aminopropyl spermidine synthase family protein [Actinobacteria bacterium]|nr:bis-aminopropyl spermidine synthase family protein [Actinomycetota bacterium]
MEELIAQIREATGTNVGIDEAKRIIASFLAAGDFWAALPYVDQPFNVAAETAKALFDRGLVEFKNSEILFTEKGKKWLDEQRIQPLIISTCNNCGGRGISLQSFSGLLKRFKELVKDRPEAIVEYDQGYVTPETTVSRVAFLAQKGDIQGKDLLILGDDDLLSIAAALSGLPNRVVVVEIDERIVNFINNVSKRENLGIETINLDLRNPLPENILRSFDTFWTDPPETVEALELFIGRGIAGLKGPGCAGYFGITYAESDKFKWRDFQKLITGKLGAVITDMITNFNEYVNWDYLLETIRNDIEPLTVYPSLNWYRSTQFRIEVLKDTPVYNEPATGKEIYVDKDALVFTGMDREEK